MWLKLTVNGNVVEWDIRPQDVLLDVLRREGYFSVKRGCETGECGSCTVLIDNVAVSACVVLAGQAEGREVTTLEGIGEWGELHALQKAFIEDGAIQCGFCTPAMLLTSLALLRRCADPTEDQVKNELAGVLCRCTGYNKPVQAILGAAKILRGATKEGNYSPRPSPIGSGRLFPLPNQMQFSEADAPATTQFKTDSRDVTLNATRSLRTVGQSEPRVDAEKLARGLPAFTDDFEIRGMLHAKILGSPYAHARIRRIDSTRAKALSGVHAVLTYMNVPRIAHTTAGQSYPEPSPYDMFCLDSKVRFVGDRVAVVAAESPDIAEQALSLIDVEYDVLEPLLGMERAMSEEAPVIHDERDATGVHDARRNVASHIEAQMGDVDKALAESAYVLDRTYRVPQVQQAPLEGHICISYLDSDGRLVLRTSTQVPFHTRRIIAQVTGLPVRRIRVIKPRIGGGFGSKQEVVVEDLCALLTLATHRPVRLALTREEEFTSSRSRHPQVLRLRMGARRDGVLTAIDLTVLSNSGAYGTHAFTVMGSTCRHATGMYRAPNVRYVGDAVYTNLPPTGAFRGYGAPQGYFALECHMDELAAKVGMDPVEFRRLNWAREGDPGNPIAKATGQPIEKWNVIQSSGLTECTDRAIAAIGWSGNKNRTLQGRYRRGIGMAIARQGSGVMGFDMGSATIKMNDDGSFNLLVGATDIGTGGDTVLSQIAAEVLGVPVEDIVLYPSDTDITPFDKGAYASSTTYVSGGAVKKAAEDVAKQIREVGAAMLSVSSEELVLANRRVISKSGKAVTFGEVALRSLHQVDQRQIIASASNMAHNSPPPFVAQCVEISVDMETGEIRPLRVATALDCGQAINPQMVEGQVEGAVTQGIGYGLCEEMVFDDQGQLTNPRFDNYHILEANEMPALETILVPTHEPTGPFGAKAAGEVAINGIAPAIVNALYDATGVRIREIPLTPERVWRALRESSSSFVTSDE